MLNILIISILFFQTSIYSLEYKAIEKDAPVSLSQYRGKHILIVNIATGSPLVRQMAELEQLYQQHKDSLVVIAFPSNSFGRETRDNAAIRELCRSTYNVHFILAQKTSVKGDGIHPVYSWLTKKSENGMLDGEVFGDFQKYLINKDGVLIGEFLSRVSPLSPEIRNAITAN